MTALFDDLTAPEFRANPYQYYRRLREQDPVHRTPDGDWMLTRYADVVSVLRDPHVWSNDSRNADASRREERVSPGVAMVMQQLLLFIDPPDHTRIRGLLNKTFTPRAVEARRPHIQAIVDGLLDDAAAKGQLDVLPDLAFPLPVVVIAEMLGVPSADHPQFKQWSQALARTIDPIVTEEQMGQAAEAGFQFIQYLVQLIGERRQDPRDDLLSALIAVEEEGDRLSQEELLANCILLFIAGHETTQNLIGNGTYALLRHRGQLERWQSDGSMTKSAVEELLRFDGPVQLTARHALSDVEVGGQPIPRGDTVIALIGAANHDPEVFAQPEHLDLGREDNRHVAFGFGNHFCLGAPLARLEGQVALSTLITRFPDLELSTDDIQYRDTMTLRGLVSLPIRWGVVHD